MKLIGTKQKKKIREESVGQIHVFSYKLLNEHVKFMHPKLSSLEKINQTSNGYRSRGVLINSC